MKQNLKISTNPQTPTQTQMCPVSKIPRKNRFSQSIKLWEIPALLLLCVSLAACGMETHHSNSQAITPSADDTVSLSDSPSTDGSVSQSNSPSADGSASSPNAVSDSHPAIDWEKVNTALFASGIGRNGYFLGEEYESDEQDFQTVSVTNYDPDSIGAFLEVPYQLSVTYGKCESFSSRPAEPSIYEIPMLQIDLIDNAGSSAYNAIYTPEGIFVEDMGDWFLDENQEEYMTKLILDARKMFGIMEVVK